MRSKWFHLKEDALGMRKKGKSITHIERNLGIPRSTLSGWFKDIKLSEKHIKRLNKNKYLALEKARKKAVKIHEDQKMQRILSAQKEALDVLGKIDKDNVYILELVLSSLYIGEGFKGSYTGMGSSETLILQFFINSIRKIYNIPITKISCRLHLRFDQDPKEIKRYWSKELNLPTSNFKGVSVDKRTKGSKTYRDYMGVCVVTCGNVAIQRRLMYLGKTYYNYEMNLGA